MVIAKRKIGIEATKGLTVTIKISGLMRVRIWLGIKVMALGAKIIGCNLAVDREEKNP